MTISSIQPNSLKVALDRADLNTMMDALRAMGFGDVIRALPTWVRNGVPTTPSATVPNSLGQLCPQVSSTQTIVLPDDAKCMATPGGTASFPVAPGGILAAYARAGSGTVGPLSVTAALATGVAFVAPAAGHVAIAPNGDLAFASADAWTAVDVMYLPEKQDVFVGTFPVVPGTGILTLPTAAGQLLASGAVSLMECNVTLGTVTGAAKIDPVGTILANIVSGHCALNFAKTAVQFLVADAVSQVTLKLGIVSAIDVNALLTATSNFG